MRKTLVYSALLLCLLFLALASCSGSSNTPTPTATAIPTAATTALATATATPAPTLGVAPLLPKGTRISARMGAFFTYQGVTYTVVPGEGGRIWGVIGKVTIAQAQSTPVGPGKKVLLLAPASYYS